MEQLKIKFDVADNMLARNLSWIASADSKIPPVLAIDTTMLGVLAALYSKTTSLTTMAVVVLIITVGILLASIVCLAVSSFPRLDGPKGSIVFFGEATIIEDHDYIKRITAGPTPELIEDIARQAYRNAEIAKAKYKAVRRATRLLFASIPFWLLALIVLYSFKVVSTTSP